MVKDSDKDISTVTQLIELIQDRGCAVDKQTAAKHSETLAKLDVKLENLIEGQAEILKRLDTLRDMEPRIATLETADKRREQIKVWLVTSVLGGSAGLIFFGKALLVAILAACGVQFK